MNEDLYQLALSAGVWNLRFVRGALNPPVLCFIAPATNFRPAGVPSPASTYILKTHADK